MPTLLGQYSKRPIYFFSKCDYCNVYPIPDAKYSCLICDDYNLCGKCENLHNHPTLKLKTLDFSNKNQLSDFFAKKIKENKCRIIDEIHGSLKNQGDEGKFIKDSKTDIIIDLPSEFFLVDINTYFFVPIILTNNSKDFIIPKDSFFGVKGPSDIFLEKKIMNKNINPGETVQFELDCLTNNQHKSYIVDICLWDSQKKREFSSFSLHVDVED